MILRAEIFLKGLRFPESPRWHDNKLWFSDIDARKVMTVDMNGKAEIIVKTPAFPSGLGWLPDNKLLIVSVNDKRLLRLDPDGLVEFADLSEIGTHWYNDMCVDTQGRAYIGNMGYDLWNDPFVPAEIVLVTPDGNARVVVDNMAFPNGTVITPDEKTLIVGETMKGCLTAFDIEEDGSLTGRRIWSKVKSPDGICLDADGGIWVASPGTGKVLHVLEGGKITHKFKVSTNQQPYACMLGGSDRCTLFIATSQHNRRGGCIETIKVDVPGAGFP